MIVFDQVLEYMIDICSLHPHMRRMLPVSVHVHLWQCYEVQLALLRRDPSVHEMPNTGGILSQRV